MTTTFELFGDEVGTTLLTSLYARAHADRYVPRSVFDDPQARSVWRAVEEAGAGTDLEPLVLQGRGTVAGTAYRSLGMDEPVRDFCRSRPGARVVSLGIGLCNRRARLADVEAQFVGVDRQAVVDLRRRLLPDDDTLLVAGSATQAAWARDIEGDRPTIVVAEGLFMYLTPEEVTEVMTIVAERFGPGTQLVADVLHPFTTRREHPITPLTGAKVRSGHSGAAGLAAACPLWGVQREIDTMSPISWSMAVAARVSRLMLGSPLYSVVLLELP